MSGRRGVALITVLAVMLAAAIMATGVSYMISRYNQRSGLNLYSESAVQASRAGEASVKSWFTYEGPEVLALLNAFLARCETGCKPYRLPMHADYLADANRNRQSFEAFLVGVVVDSADADAPVSIKVQVNAQGQDEAQSVVTLLYELRGVSFQRATPQSTATPAAVVSPDALYITGGEFQDVITPTLIEGSAYVQSAFKTIAGGKVHVTGDLVFGKDIEAYINDSLVVDGNLYVAGDFRLESGGRAWVKGNSVFKTHLKYLNGPFRVEGDAYFADTVGSGSLAVSSNGINDSLSIGGNATFMNSVQVMGTGKLRVQGDAGFMNAAGYLRAGTGGRIKVQGNALVYPTVCWQDVGAALFAGTFVHTLLQGTACTGFSSTEPSLGTGASWDGWNTAASAWTTPKVITAATQLTDIAAKLGGGTDKEVPFTLSATSIAHIADSLGTRWGTLFPNPQSAGGWRAQCDSRDASEGVYTTNQVRTTVLQCLAEEMPDSVRYNGHVLLDLRGTYWNANLVTEKLSDSYVILVDQGPITLPPTTAAGRILVYYTGTVNPVIQVVGADTCNCVIYSQKGLQFGLGVFNGNIVINNTSGATDRTQTTNATGVRTFRYDADVLNDLITSGLFLDADGNPLGGGSTLVYSPRLLALLSPRLEVKLVGERWGSTTMDLSSAVSFGRSLHVVPAMVIAEAGEFTSWSAFAAQRAIAGYVLPVTSRDGCSEPAPLSTSGVDFATAGTYTVQFYSTCDVGNSPTGNLIVWVVPAGSTAASSGSGTSSGTSSAAGTSAGSSTAASSAAASSAATSSSSAAASGGVTYEFKITGTCPASGNTLQFGVLITNNLGSVLNLKHYRLTFFMNDGYAASSWARQPGSPWNGTYQDNVKDVTLAFSDLVAGGTSPRLYNRMVRVGWNADTYVVSGAEAGFNDLSLIHLDWSSINGADDYSYDGCTSEYVVNDYVLFESDLSGNWEVVSGTAPDYALLVSSSAAASSSAGASSSGTAGGAGCTCPSGCSSVTTVTIPYTVEGVFAKCVFAATRPSNVNMWNGATANINGTSYSGYSSALPSAVDGGYYMYVLSTGAYGHFEAQ